MLREKGNLYICWTLQKHKEQLCFIHTAFYALAIETVK